MTSATTPAKTAPGNAAPKKSARQLEWDRQYAVHERIEALLCGKDPKAGGKLVAHLHGPDGIRFFRRMSTGIDRPGGGVGAYLSFAEACHHYDRVDILRAVYLAGPPQWLKDIVPLTAQPLKSDPSKLESKDKLNRRQFKALGFRLPKLDATRDWVAPGDWLNALCVRQFAMGHLPVHRSVLSIATDRIDHRTRLFLDFYLDTKADGAIRLDDGVFDLRFGLLNEPTAEVKAIIRELQMRRAMTASEKAAPAGVPTSAQLEIALEPAPQRRTSRRSSL